MPLTSLALFVATEQLGQKLSATMCMLCKVFKVIQIQTPTFTKKWEPERKALGHLIGLTVSLIATANTVCWKIQGYLSRHGVSPYVCYFLTLLLLAPTWLLVYIFWAVILL